MLQIPFTQKEVIQREGTSFELVESCTFLGYSMHALCSLDLRMRQYINLKNVLYLSMFLIDVYKCNQFQLT